MSNYRAPLRTVQTDWRAGEIDPDFAMRIDSPALPSGARNLRNMLLRSTGGAERRPGMRTLRTMGATRVRLFEFDFDADEKYIVGLTPGTIRVWDAAGTQLYSAGSMPWLTDAVVWEINFIQKGDVMLLVHTSFKIRRLRRITLTSFSVDQLQFSTDTAENVLNQPFLRYAPVTGNHVGLNDFTASNSVLRTLTITPAVLSVLWEGERIRIWDKEIQIVNVTSASTASVYVRQTVRAELGIAPFFVERAGDQSIEVTHAQHGIVADATGHAVVRVDNSTDLFGIPADKINGIRTIGIIDPDHYAFVIDTAGGTVFSTSGGDGGGANVTIQPVSPTTLQSYTEQVWSDRRGWPGAIALHENRLWMAGSKGAPTFLAGSAVGDYFDFNVRDGLDDESVQGTISATSRIVHLVSAKVLQVFTELNEAVVEVQNGEPITPGSLKVITQTGYGADPNVRPKLFDGATLFAQRNGKNVRELVYDYNTDSHVAPPLSVLASHMINKPNDLAVLPGTATRAEQYAFFINANGTCAVFHSIRAEKLAGWTLFTAGGGGLFDSVCVIGSSIFFSVKRDGEYYLDRLELDADDVWLDSAIRLSSTIPSAVWVLGTAYAGNTVQVMSNGYLLGSFVATAAGVVTLPEPVTAIVAGFDYGIIAQPMPPDREMTDGSMTAQIRRIVSSSIHFARTASAAVNGVELFGYQSGGDPTLPPPQVSRKHKVRHLGYGVDPSIVITQPTPGPMLVMGIVHEVSI
jgi:hypothetical protein